MNYFVSKQFLIAKSSFVLLFLFSCTPCFAVDVPIYDFSISAYSQNANNYLPSTDYNYKKTLLSPEYQNVQLRQFYKHYYSSNAQGLSPWSEQMIMAVLPFLKKTQAEILEEFNNQDQPDEAKHYAENFKEHDQLWWNKIKENMNLQALTLGEYKDANRAISVNNTLARALPDATPDFFHFTLPGQGFPFDNLQEASIWAGTPLYVFSLSKDKAWSLVLTPDGYFSWVKSRDIAYVSPEFIKKWQESARHNLVAITQTEATIVDSHQQFQFTGYIGSVFPLMHRNARQTFILIPVKNTTNQAVIKTGIIDTNASSIMPLAASPQNFVKIIEQLKNRPYGWGGAFFFNDCSQETKSLFTPFAIWLPKNSAQQAKLSPALDLSTNTMDERLALLKEKGHPLMTLIYIGGHVMLYIGNKQINNEATAITYQNVWGMTSENRDKRYVIGQSLFFPLLKHYSEHADINSFANKSQFKLIYLNALNTNADSPHRFVHTFFKVD